MRDYSGDAESEMLQEAAESCECGEFHETRIFTQAENSTGTEPSTACGEHNVLSRDFGYLAGKEDQKAVPDMANYNPAAKVDLLAGRCGYESFGSL